MKLIILSLSLITAILFTNQKNEIKYMSNNTENIKMDTATFGTGCFWCTEAIFQQVEGVAKVVSGYSGGKN